MPFTRTDLSALPEAEQQVAIEERVAELHASLNLSAGPLLQTAFFDLGANKPSRLLLIIHHLAVDAVSWRILLEDLQTAYQQLSRGQPIQLPSKTTSFKQWAQRLSEYAQSEALQDDLDCWLTPSWTQIPSLPKDYPEGANTIASARSTSVSLSAEETVALLQEVPRAYNTQINDVLLTALVQAFARWTGAPSLLIDLEWDGRENIVAGVDLSRTVGWFTTVFPVLLDLEDASNPGDALKSVKEQLRGIPNRGTGYGSLRYLRGDAEIAEKMRALPQPEVSFNYLGQFDRVVSESSPFRLARGSSGPTLSHRGSRINLLEISGIVIEGRLVVDWTYSENNHRRSTIEGLAQGFVAALRELIALCQSPEAVGYTPSDFPGANLSQEELEKAFAEAGFEE